MTVDIYSDVVCPWCYIGKRKFEAGLDLVDGEDLGVDFDVTYRPFQLDPTARAGRRRAGRSRPTPRSSAAPSGPAEIIRNVSDRAAEVGLEFNMDRALRANTLLAHRLIWFADQPGSPVVEQAAMKERLLQAYFTDGLDIGDPEVLADCAAEIGLDRRAVLEFLESDRGTAEVAAELAEARDEGITAVPTYVFNGKWAVPGAQEPETFAQVLRKMATDATARQRRLTGHVRRQLRDRIVLAHGFTQTARSWDTVRRVCSRIACRPPTSSPSTCPGTAPPPSVQRRPVAERRPPRREHRRSRDLRRLLDGRPRRAARRARPSASSSSDWS